VSRVILKGSLLDKIGSVDLTMAGSVSARLVAVATAERGVSSDLKCVLLIIEAA